MAFLDSQGRLFGKVSLLDLGAGGIILAAVSSLFLAPSLTGSVAQVGAKKQALEVEVLIKGFSAADASGLMADIRREGQSSIIIRNQPYGQVKVLSAQLLPRTIPTPQPDGSLKAQPDPRPEAKLTSDALLTLTGDATKTTDGYVFGNSKVKVGTPIELEGQSYRFGGSVIGLRAKS